MRWCEASTTPAVVVDRDGVLLWANRSGAAFVRANAVIRLVNGRVATTDPTQDADLRRFIRDLGDEPGVWVCKSDGGHVLVRGDISDPPGLPRAVGLSFFPAKEAPDYLWADIRQVFGLTGAEASVVRRLMEGHRVEVISGNMNVSVETVRTHIRRIYNKLGVSSREELFSEISPFRVR